MTYVYILQAPQIQNATTWELQTTYVLACKGTTQAKCRTPQNTRLDHQNLHRLH